MAEVTQDPVQWWTGGSEPAGSAAVFLVS